LNKTCKKCGRTYGVDMLKDREGNVDWTDRFCSSGCYTKHLMEQKTGVRSKEKERWTLDM
jgi:hypothetical protein